ncbi:hypothetical protein GGI07_004621 [Coemansia sp. Benny D115]|nr:hypothetical protein GGI07_004621 [Coemansia sp. Benny D115]
MAFDEGDSVRGTSESNTNNAGGGSGAGGGSASWGADADAPLDSPRDKFRREPDSPDRRDHFGRDYRSRSPSDMRANRRRSRSPPRRGSAMEEGDRYIPHYERDRESGGDRYTPGGGNGGRYGGNRSYNSGGGRGNHRHSNRGGDHDGYGHGGDMMGGGGGRVGSMADPRNSERVVPFKYYAEWLKTQEGGRRLEQEEIRERYEEYRREALQRLYTQFFSVHKDSDWFCERFDPERRKEYMHKLAEQKAEKLRDFVADLDAGKFDNLSQTATTEQIMQHEVNRRDPSNANRLGGGDEEEDASIKHTLFIRTVPPSVPRAVLEDELRKHAGFKYLALSEPRQDKQYHRFGWVRFENGTDMEKTMESLSNVNIDQFQFHFSRHNNNSSAILRLTPDVTSTDERIRHDLKLVREAVQSMDERTDPETFHMLETLQKKAWALSRAAGELPAGSSSGPKAEGEVEEGEGVAVKGEGEEAAENGDVAMGEEGESEGDAGSGSRENIAAARRELDLLLEYLRRVHYYCYYCGHTADSAEDFLRRCAKQHLRRGLPGNRGPQPSGNWTRYQDNNNNLIIHPLEADRLYKEGGKSLEKETDKELDAHINQLDEGRYRCMQCSKLFKGDAFVRKHIRNKHPESVPDTLVREISFFNNFVREAPRFVQLGTGSQVSSYMGGAVPMMGGGGGNGGGGGGMRDRTSGGFVPQMMPGMMIPGMMAAPYMMPGMVPGMMPGMMQMGGHFMGHGMMGMMPGDRGQAMYSQQYRGRNGNSGNGRGGSGFGNAGSGGNRGGDPRAVRSYVDLDAPAEGEADFGF